MRPFIAAACLVAGLLGLASAVSAKTPYDIDTTAMADRGKLTAVMAGNPALGSKFIDEDGWYTLILPQGGDTLEADGGRDFYMAYGQTQIGVHTQKHSDTVMINDTPAQLDARVDAFLVPGSPEDNDVGQAGTIRLRSTLTLGDAGHGLRGVRAAVWAIATTSADNKSFDMLYIEIPSNRGILEVMCLGSENVCLSTLKAGLRLGDGAFPAP